LSSTPRIAIRIIDKTARSIIPPTAIIACIHVAIGLLLVHQPFHYEDTMSPGSDVDALGDMVG